MKYHVIINSVKTVDELKNAWTKEDYIALLDKFGLEETDNSSLSELLELLAMAITDFEPEEAAAIVLDYKLSQQLNENQIEQISHEILLDKISEEYSLGSFFLIFTLIPIAVGLISILLNPVLKKLMHGVR